MRIGIRIAIEKYIQRNVNG